ncbi:ABC transporter permease [Brucella sp. BE17]|uniref:ABC transporter permease n=1 Tax=Brucella sp. BE17 TaxID=3142977 RepID=UPI0031BB05DF
MSANTAAHRLITANSIPRLDRLGLTFAFLGAAGLLLPFATFRANRIVPGEPRFIFDALPMVAATILVAIIVASLIAAVFCERPAIRLGASLAMLAVVFVTIGLSASHLAPEGNNYARVSPASGFWLLLFAAMLYVTDSLVRLHLRPLIRMALVVIAALLLLLFFSSGLWDDISFMKEYQGRADSFWNEARNHIELALGSLTAATLVGIPLGLLCHHFPKLRALVLNTLNIVQTIPSMALFGLLIAPLSWFALQFPFAASLGIRGIGTAPAFIALFLYSLLPIVANTVAGLASVPEPIRDAARGMGMTRMQRLFKTELPLALPVILTGIRIVMVQNIGLTTIAALIGGGGFGVFIFQGIGQTAMDLVLLGALPTVLLAFAAGAILDALIEITDKEKG